MGHLERLPTELKLMLFQGFTTKEHIKELYYLGSISKSFQAIFKRYEPHLLLAIINDTHPTKQHLIPLAIHLGGTPPVTSALQPRRDFLNSVLEAAKNAPKSTGRKAAKPNNSISSLTNRFLFCSHPPPIFALQRAFDLLPRMEALASEIQRIHQCGHLTSHLMLSDTLYTHPMPDLTTATYLAILRFKLTRKLAGKKTTIQNAKFKEDVRKWIAGLDAGAEDVFVEEVGKIIRALEHNFAWTCYVHQRGKAVWMVRAVLDTGVKTNAELEIKQEAFDGGRI